MQLLQTALLNARQREEQALRAMGTAQDDNAHLQAYLEYRQAVHDIDTALIQLQELEKGTFDEQYKYE